MNFEAGLRQYATVWARGLPDGYGGNAWTRSLVRCRWEHKVQMTVDSKGQQIGGTARVFLLQDINVGDFIMLGTSIASTPPSTAYEVMNFCKTPSLQADQFERYVIV